MSFETLSKKELLRTAEEDFAVDVDASWNKAKIIEELKAAGVDYGQYLVQNPDKNESNIPDNIVQSPVVPAAKTEDNVPKLLIKMVRANPLYQIGKYRWTQKHPYVAVEEKEAERILMTEDGFRQATPSELQEYYA